MAELRSDTFTRPSAEMLEAMMTAEVGDDVFGEDPTVNKLEQLLADMFGMEAGLFASSGTMTNQIAIRLHTKPQDEVICDKNSHIYLYEGGGIAANSGVTPTLLDGDRGRITAEQVVAAIKPDDVHAPVSRLISLENTMNKGGGSYYDIMEIRRIRQVADKYGLSLHLDGARLFNALVETGDSTLTFGELFDTISICLSKGLGAPVGSVLLGTREHINQARRVRKVFGGGMRQAGYLAAAGIYALKNNVDLLKEDHRRAREIASTLNTLPWVEEVMPIDTNILIFAVQDTSAILEPLKQAGILALPFGPKQIRFVTHLDFTDDDLQKTIDALKSI